MAEAADPGIVGLIVGIAVMRRAQQILRREFSPDEAAALASASASIWTVLCACEDDPLGAIEDFLTAESSMV